MTTAGVCRPLDPVVVLLRHPRHPDPRAHAPVPRPNEAPIHVWCGEMVGSGATATWAKCVSRAWHCVMHPGRIDVCEATPASDPTPCLSPCKGSTRWIRTSHFPSNVDVMAMHAPGVSYLLCFHMSGCCFLRPPPPEPSGGPCGRGRRGRRRGWRWAPSPSRSAATNAAATPCGRTGAAGERVRCQDGGAGIENMHNHLSPPLPIEGVGPPTFRGAVVGHRHHGRGRGRTP